MIDCGDCFYSQLIDGVLFCNHYGEDICIGGSNETDCKSYVNVENLKNTLQYYNSYLKENLDDIKNLEEVYDNFLTENKDLI